MATGLCLTDGVEGNGGDSVVIGDWRVVGGSWFGLVASAGISTGRRTIWSTVPGSFGWAWTCWSNEKKRTHL